jgi:GNAT superfamily N-acetyltransferase
MITLDEVPLTSTPAKAMMACAEDELDRRYGVDTDRHPFDDTAFEVPRGVFLVARVNGHLAGCVGLREVAPQVAEIKRLWVRPDLRRIGLAKTLMDEAERRGFELGHELLELETGTKQPEAVAFYQKQGWTRVDELPVKVSDYPLAQRFIKPKP